jgi:2-oxoglutarate ferredoxin oxidoreductase subunit beta
VIFVNNTTYGMTGGQMAPTTLVGQKTSTSPYGRNKEKGFSFVEVLSSCPANLWLTPLAANARVEEVLIPCYPLGVFRNDENL